jgi:hypothetical protein
MWVKTYDYYGSGWAAWSSLGGGLSF